MAMTGSDWAGLAAGVGSSVLGAVAANKQAKTQQAMTQAQIDEEKRQFDKQFGQNQAQLGLEATQLNPFAQQQARQRQAMANSLLGNYAPASYNASTGKYEGGLMSVTPETLKGAMSFFTPEAMAASENAFTQTARAASPTYRGADAANAGALGYNTDALKQFSNVGYRSPSADSGGVDSLIASLTAPTLGGNKAAKVGSTIGGVAGSFLGPVGGAVGSAIGGYLGGKTYTSGEKTNDLRDQFKGQFGDVQGNAMAKLILEGENGANPTLRSSYDRFMTAGKPEDLQAAILQIIASLKAGNPPAQGVG